MHNARILRHRTEVAGTLRRVLPHLNVDIQYQNLRLLPLPPGELVAFVKHDLYLVVFKVEIRLRDGKRDLGRVVIEKAFDH